MRELKNIFGVERSRYACRATRIWNAENYYACFELFSEITREELIFGCLMDFIVGVSATAGCRCT